MPNTHAQFTCKRILHSFFLVMVAFRALADQLNPCESIIWCLTTAARNFYQPARSIVIMPSRGHGFLFMTVSEARVLDYLGAIAST